MPELPEVETVRSLLSPYLVHQKILAVTVNLPKVTTNLTPAQFCARLTGQTITAFTRRAKYLLLHLDSGAHVVVHFRMTGTLMVENAQIPPQKHTNLILTLANDQQLRYIDARGFGRWWYFDPGAPLICENVLLEATCSPTPPVLPTTKTKINYLGPEPENVTAAYLTQALGTRHTAIKKLLLDQSIVAGIGNIYADEICFTAHILPTRWGNSLTSAEIALLAQTIPERLQYFTAKHHVPFAVYAASQGTSYQDSTYLQVYGRAGKPCLRCGTLLVGTRIGGRSSVYCPNCQH